MATRRERVLLELEDQFTAKMAAAAASTALLDRNLRSLSGSAVQSDRSLAKTNQNVRTVGDSSDRSGKQIDRLSGRLALLAQAAAVLGPALAPLGAPLVTVMAGLTAQLGAVAGGVGVMVLAFKGMGDGLKAVNAYQLEPTAENLQAMRIEMEKLGPAGAEFVRYLDSLGPQLSTLQMTAREGLLPGAQDGLEELMTMLPRVRSIVSDLAEAMGGLAADAGADLAGPEWERFFRYLDNEAGPLLTEFGRTVGNFANGFANMVVAMNPLTADFSSGMLEMSQSFENWSATLGSNDSFQGFLDYVQKSGPKAVDFLGSLVDALAAIVSAAAPVGDAVLPILTKMLDVVGALASTDMGTMFFAAAAGMSVYSRAATLVAAANTRMASSSLLTWRQTKALGAGLGIAALSFTDLDEKAGLSNTAMLGLAGSIGGLWGAAAGAAIGLTMDLAAANDDLTTAVENANKVLDEGGTDSQVRRNIRAVRDEIAATEDALTEGFFSMNKPKQMLTGINEMFGIFGPNTDDARDAVEMLTGSLHRGAGLADLFAGGIGYTSDELRGATHAAEDFTGALAQMAGWLDKRAALRAYQEELKNFGTALKNGFQPKNEEALDRVATGIIQVASQMKNVENRADFMAGARRSLIDFAGTGPKAKAAVDEVIDKFVRLGLMEPRPKIDVDTKGADGKIDRTGSKVDGVGKKRAKPRVDADTRSAEAGLKLIQRFMNAIDSDEANPFVGLVDTQFYSAARGVRGEMNALDGKRATTYIDTIRTTINRQVGPAYNAGKPSADGSTVPKTGLPYADRHPYLLADGEEIISNRYGQADRHRSLLKAINAGRLADGGTAGDRGGRNPLTGGALVSPELFNILTGSLRGLNRALKDSEKAVDAEKRQRDSLVSQRDSLRSGIREGLGEDDIWAVAANPWTAGATASPTDKLRQKEAEANEFTRLVKALRGKGLDGAALAEVIGSGDVERARMMAAMSASDLRGFDRQYNRTERALQAAGVAGGAAVGYNAQIAESNKELRELRAEVRSVKQELKSREKAADRREDRADKSREKAADRAGEHNRRGAARGMRNRRNG